MFKAKDIMTTHVVTVSVDDTIDYAIYLMVKHRISGLPVVDKRGEEALKSNERKFRTISDSAIDAIIMIDSAGNIAHWNHAAEAIFGYSSEEILGHGVHEILAPSRHREAASKGLSRFATTGQGAAIGKIRELAALRKDGTEFPVELSLNSINQDDGWWAVAVLRDITERELTEQQLEQYQVARAAHSA